MFLFIMGQCKATLEEHARWSQLVREAKNFLESGGRLADSVTGKYTYEMLYVLYLHRQRLNRQQ